MAGNKSTKGGRLLCLDGGGIRGLILAVMLLELEKELGCPVIHCFDWVAGTSTGGILTLGLAAGIVSSVEPLKAACQKEEYTDLLHSLSLEHWCLYLIGAILHTIFNP